MRRRRRGHGRGWLINPALGAWVARNARVAPAAFQRWLCEVTAAGRAIALARGGKERGLRGKCCQRRWRRWREGRWRERKWRRRWRRDGGGGRRRRRGRGGRWGNEWRHKRIETTFDEGYAALVARGWHCCAYVGARANEARDERRASRRAISWHLLTREVSAEAMQETLAVTAVVRHVQTCRVSCRSNAVGPCGAEWRGAARWQPAARPRSDCGCPERARRLGRR